MINKSSYLSWLGLIKSIPTAWKFSLRDSLFGNPPRIDLQNESMACTGFVRLRENLENLEKGNFLKKIRENRENSGNFLTIFTTSGKTQGILFCQISLLSNQIKLIKLMFY